MIESYFIKSLKRKNENETDQVLEEIPKKAHKGESLNEKKSFNCKIKDITPDDICAILTSLTEPRWQKITAKNLKLDYALLFNKSEAYKMFCHLEKEIVYEKNSMVHVFGKWHKVPRKQASYGDRGVKYTFSGATVSAKPWTPCLRELRDLMVRITGMKFNFVLVNRYKDGNDHIGEHKDDESELVPHSPIVSLSFGEARDFIFRHQDSRGAKGREHIEPVKLNLKSGSILIMKYPTNEYWYHSLPVRKRCLGPRINLTFRQMII